MQYQNRILIIDDDPVIRLLTTQALRSTDLVSTVANSGEKGLEVFQENGADAILLDVMMPNGMDGFEFCSLLRKLPEGKHIPVLMMTGLDDLESINRAFESGATDFITKPINFGLLSHRVRYMLRAANTTKRLLDSERRLHRMAYYDSLTELPNRLFFREHLQYMIPLAERQKQKLAILFLDLDGFKRINDTLGHHIGDLVLQETGNRLRKSLRSSDVLVRSNDLEENVLLARLGGDEFTVLLSRIMRDEDVAVVSERIRHNLSQPFIFEDHEIHTSTSIGIAIFPDDGDSADELLKNADMAMYYAKREGGKTYQYFSSEMTEASMHRLNLENRLRKAIERNEFTLSYQPLFDISSNRYLAVEALIRWHNKEQGLISPNEFISLAEETGLIISVGEWVLRTACKQVKEWLDKGIHISRVAVNVSGLQLMNKSFAAQVTKILSETGLAPPYLELELTETALISDVSDVLEQLNTLKQIGVHLAIDDFGMGYSSLNRLRLFPIDRLKIGQTFVEGIEDTSEKDLIARAVIGIAGSMGMKTTAEGVETGKQIAFLKSAGCDEAQGYYLCKPLPSHNAEQFFQNQSSMDLNTLVFVAQ